MGTLTREEILERKAQLERAAEERLVETAEVQTTRANGFKYVRPFADAYQGVLESIVNVDGRFTLGLSEIDTLTRGFAAKELVMLVGFSHAGKTQMVNTAILNNQGKRILFFSMDDPAEMILIKLACMQIGMSAETLEHKIRGGDGEARHALHSAATDSFRNLIVVDQSLGLGGMEKTVLEATQYWGAPPEFVVVDYLGSMAGDDDAGDDGGIKQKAMSLKRWCKDKPFPTMVLHQNTRGRGAPGEPISMMSGAYGGEQEATVLMGVRRKRDWKDLDSWEREHHANSITVHVVKNKRPPSKITPVDGIDLYMDPNTGLVRRMKDDDWPRAVMNKPMTSAEDAASLVRSAA